MGASGDQHLGEMPKTKTTTAAAAPQPLDIDAAFRAHGAFVARVVQRLVGPGPHVDDLTQEVFIVAYKKRHDFEGRSSVQTWLYAIARNLCFRHLRSQRRFHFFQGKMASQEVAEEPAGPHEDAERKEGIARVRRVLQQLPVKQREVAVLYELEGLEGRVIADMVGVPIGTVWTRLTQARKSLEQLMRREMAKEGEL